MLFTRKSHTMPAPEDTLPGRPGSVSAGAGMVWDLRVKSMFLRYREEQFRYSR